MDMKSREIIILGAGLTGLTMGFYLKKAGKDFVIIEKDDRTGGVINTLTENGFVYEQGPNTGVLSTPEIAQLFDDLDDRCSLETAGPGSGKRYILKNGKWNSLPSGPVSAVTTPLFTLKDKFRILGEPFRKPGNDPDETLSSMVVRRLGKSFLDYAVDPFVSGIYAGDPGKLIPRFALPKLYALEQNYGSFIRGAIAKSREPKTEAMKKATKEVFSVRGGLKNLVEALTVAAGRENILTSCRDTVVTPGSGNYGVTFINGSGESQRLTAPVVISTIGAYGLPDVLPFIPADLMKKISVLNYASIVQVAAGYHSWQGKKLDAFGGLVPSREKRDILGILFPSAIFKGRAPEKGALLSVFLGGIKNPGYFNKNDDEITDTVLKEIRSTLYCNSQPDLLKINRYLHAIPQYDITSGDRIESIKIIQDMFPGLILAGNLRDGIGMADRVKQAVTISGLLTS
jgi:oxygen-dependent protoporphyrinogen oxidase